MATQTTYNETMDAARVGMLANTELKNLISRDVETAEIGFGVAVKQGTADMGVEAATAANDEFRGISVRDRSVNPENPNSFSVGDSAQIMTKGVIWVTAGEAVTAGAPAYMKVGTADAGKFMVTTTSNLAIPNAVFDTSGAKDALVKLRIG